MNRPTRSKAGLTLAIVAALAATSAALAPFAAAQPASDEYVLEFPGVGQNLSGTQVDSSRDAASSGDGLQRGVVGETSPPDDRLESLGSTLAAAPAALVVGLALLMAVAVATRLAAPDPRAREIR